MSAVPSLPDSITKLARHNSEDIHSPVLIDITRTGGACASLSNGFELPNLPVDHSRRMKVIIIGAGFSGIYLGIRIPQRLSNVELVIYDKNEDVGGTWFENKYLGCACDVPSHSYQFSFNPNPNWSALYAPAAEIQAYLSSTVKKYSVDRFIKLSHKVEECRYEESSGKWKIKIKNLTTQEIFEDSCDVLLNARGGLNTINWPDIRGLKSFRGEVMHSAKWNQSYDFENRRIGVIGSGSSSIQIVPKLQQLPGTRLSCFVRNKTWISPPFGQNLWDSMNMKEIQFSEAQKAQFFSDPEAYLRFRLKVEEGGNAIHSFTMRGTPIQAGARDLFSKSMKQRLQAKPEIYDTLLPDFSPGCRRLTPGVGYLEALCESNVDFITSPIQCIEESGIRTQDGKLCEIDVLVCATGFKASAPPPFAIIGKRGKTLSEHWSRYPRTYLSLATDSFPNHFIMLGPNAAIGTGSLTMMIESTADYIVRCLRKMQKENLKSMEVRSERVDDFIEVAQTYFKGTVFSEACRSWYKNSHGEVTGLWPGSTQACIEVMRSPRWEDWQYEALPSQSITGAQDDSQEYRPAGRVSNMLSFLGNGWTANQLAGKHLAYYLYPQYIDVPPSPFPEQWSEGDIRPFSH